ncbi:HupE/UreJ family protein [Microvirga lotononidis]|uniref:Hydrogenase/urease accessory protein n=1 Tax=Microvirga lotononidis TaxID=864069 RepID=I4Z1X0_9HYPH|nr:HupE/UreJ family protein [Microvirga lotononidis]EIM30212.1 hydrogenase/urease accessory protein [Microvirga lotononidis]WQO31566.1 HupE/UreJ family protein [Microvirga lotononidis]
MIRPIIAALASAVMLAPTAALAHTGHGDAAGFTYGIAHPISGIDHVLAMVSVGLLAALIGGRALWLLPLTFISVMAGAAVLGMTGFDLPSFEVWIAGSLVALGLAVAYPSHLSSLTGAGLIAVLAVFHGYAHGAEMPAGASGLAYAAGFVMGTVLLIGIGTGAALLAGIKGGQLGPRVLRGGGGAAIGLYGLAALSVAL